MSSYANIANFGKENMPPCYGTNDPLTYCLTDSMDVGFTHGSLSHLYGPRSQKCQRYMAQRCADKWDGFCEYFYEMNGNSGEWPDNQRWPNTSTPPSWVSTTSGVSLTSGEQLLSNVAMQKYCSFENCQKKCERFDPTNPDSPMITYYETGAGGANSCIPVCNVNPSIIDSDPVIDRMMLNPKAASTTLINICNTARNTGTNLSGTKIGSFCDRYFQSLQQM